MSRQSNFYDPAPAIVVAEGVIRRVCDARSDSFIGPAEGLVATGLLTMDMLPGQPGRPASSVTYRPRGTAPGKPGSWFTPGVLQVFCIGLNKYRATLAVSHAEQERRQFKRSTRYIKDEACEGPHVVDFADAELVIRKFQIAAPRIIASVKAGQAVAMRLDTRTPRWVNRVAKAAGDAIGLEDLDDAALEAAANLLYSSHPWCPGGRIWIK